MTPAALAGRIAALAGNGGRKLIALTGPPGSGKSTLAERLAAGLSARGLAAEVVPMDGFHLDNAILTARALLPRKGAPETFDAAGFLALIQRLKTGGEVVIPVFDRARDIAIAGGRVIGADRRLLIVEGNYLLFDEPDWRPLAALWDLSVFLDVPEPVLAQRLTRRWLDHGLPSDAARARAESNDLPNARRILARRLPADVVLAASPADAG